MLYASLIFLAASIIAVTSETSPCDSDDWRYYNGYCYWSSNYHGDNKHHRSNWFSAARECRKKNADLASIHSPGENHVVFMLNRCADTWTGLNMMDHTLKTKISGWEWFDGSQRNYVNWQSGYPHNSYSECTYLNHGSSSGQWMNYQNCGSYKTYYVCKKQANGGIGFANRTHLLGRGACEAGWVSLSGKCYHVNTNKVDYFAALLDCQAKKSHLVTLHSSKDEGDLSRVFNGCDTPWIGVENVDPAKVNKNEGWKWNDNTIVDYSNWRDEGIFNDVKKQCGLLQRGAQWANVHCWELHPYVCEKPNPAAKD